MNIMKLRHWERPLLVVSFQRFFWLVLLFSQHTLASHLLKELLQAVVLPEPLALLDSRLLDFWYPRHSNQFRLTLQKTWKFQSWTRILVKSQRTGGGAGVGVLMDACGCGAGLGFFWICVIWGGSLFGWGTVAWGSRLCWAGGVFTSGSFFGCAGAVVDLTTFKIRSLRSKAIYRFLLEEDGNRTDPRCRHPLRTNLLA